MGIGQWVKVYIYIYIVKLRFNLQPQITCYVYGILEVLGESATNGNA